MKKKQKMFRSPFVFVQVMANQEVVTYLSESMLVWACSVRRPEGYRVSQVVSTLWMFLSPTSTIAAGLEGEYLSLPGNDCTASAQNGCSWQAGRLCPGVKLWEHSVEKI